jgi:hypothetical protein
MKGMEVLLGKRGVSVSRNSAEYTKPDVAEV